MHLNNMIMYICVNMLGHSTLSPGALYIGKALAQLVLMWLTWISVNLGQAPFEKEGWKKMNQVSPNECQQNTSPVYIKQLAHLRPKHNLNLRKGHHTSLWKSRGENYDALTSSKLLCSSPALSLLVGAEVRAGKWDHTYSPLPRTGGGRISALAVPPKQFNCKRKINK